ncbi:MAG: DEAD/DEAH box helicase, partial [Candidatus Gracilibacteria bacterium]|nr:DEAD/DEAH box helicase [Candidatus Gracilibacteria bacterium]
SKVRKIISNEENFNWKEFGELCDILPSIVDSRNKSDSSVTGIGYDKIYKKNGLKFLPTSILKTSMNQGREMLISELSNLVSKIEYEEKLSLETLKKNNIHLYNQILKSFNVDENSIESWGNFFDNIPEQLANQITVRPDTGRERHDKIIDLIGTEEMERIFITHGENPSRMYFLIRIMHPHLSEQDIKNIVRHSFKGLGENAELLFDKIQDFDIELDHLDEVEIEIEKIGFNNYRLSGEAPSDCNSLYIKGPWSRSINVNAGKKFQVDINIREGDNEIVLINYDQENEIRSENTFLLIQGEKDLDAELSFLRLLGEIKNLEELLESNEGQRELIQEAMEMTFLKFFSYDFEIGKDKIADLLENITDNRTVSTLLIEMLRKFVKINDTKYDQLRQDNDISLMFFQKYCVYKINQLRERGVPGVILAPEPGLGKTIIAQVAISRDEALIVCPNSVVSTWGEEAAKFMENPSVELIYDMSMEDRKKLLKHTDEKIKVTNQNTLRDHENDALFEAINTKTDITQPKTIVFDEAHFLKNTNSNQSKGARKLIGDFSLFLTASPFKNVNDFGKLMNALLPEDTRFKNPSAFRKAFPPHDINSYRQLNLLKKEYTIRFLKSDVLATFDKNIPLDQQNNCLPQKEYINPKDNGVFTMLPQQADAISLLMRDSKKFHKKYGEYFDKNEIDREDKKKLFTSGDYLTKKHALRQIVNNPKYIGLPNVESPKTLAMQEIIQKEITQGGKVVIFCAYNEQSKKYQELFDSYKPCMFIGETTKKGFMSDESGVTLKFEKNIHNEWEFDDHGYPVPSENGESMKVSDYERLTFQHSDDRQILITTYQSGGVGTTFTRAHAMIFDDLPEDYIIQYQAEDRIHRIDNKYKKYVARYYSLISQYPNKFLQANKDADDCKKFTQGTFDEVHKDDLDSQKVIFGLINNEVDDKSSIDKLNQKTLNYFKN